MLTHASVLVKKCVEPIQCLDGSDRVFDRLPSLSHPLRFTVKSALHRVNDVFGQPLAAAVVAHAREQLMLGGVADNSGLLLNAPRPSVLRFMPALTVTQAEVDLMIEGLTASLDAVGVAARIV